MSFSARSCRAALRQTAQRTFTTSACRGRSLPVFEQASTHELEDVLAKTKQRLLVPRHLNPAQRKLVFKDKERARLEADPVYTTVGGQEVQLEHINVQRDLPGLWPMFSQAIELSQTREDWTNIERLLEGFSDAKIKVKEAWLEKFVRSAFQAGFEGVVLQCLYRVKRTWLSLSHVGVTEQIMWGLHKKAVNSEWDEESTKKVLSFAEQTVDLMEMPEHCGSRRVQKGDVRTLPFVVAVPLEMAASQALKHPEDAASRQKVEKYAERLMVNLRHYGTQPITINNNDRSFKRYYAATATIMEQVPTWQGLTLAQKVLGGQMPQVAEAQKAVAELEKQINDGLDAIKQRYAERGMPKAFKEHWAVKVWEARIR